MLISATLTLAFLYNNLDLIATGLAPHGGPDQNLDALHFSGQHLQHKQQFSSLLAHHPQDSLFGGQQNGADQSGDPNFQLDITGDPLSSSQDQIDDPNQQQQQHNDLPAGYYYPDQSSGHGADVSNHNNIGPEFDTSLLSNNFNNQGLPTKDYLSHYLAGSACRLDRGCQRKDRLNNTYLSHCTRYKLENLFSNDILMSIMHDSTEECEKILDEFIQLDELINQFDQYFKKLLTRYNCHNGYSVKWSCEDCKKAYKDWLCATSLPYYMNGERIKPCISFCERVEQRCPYLHPITKEQYGGQPVFICRDPNIPFVPEITPDIPYSEPAKCYDLCHLSDNATELLIDSLSKYNLGECPTKGSIAEEVRSDPLYCSLELDQRPANQSKVHHSPELYDTSSMAEYPRENDETRSNNPNETTTTTTGERKPVSAKVHVHRKKIEELKEVLTVNDRSIDHAKHWSTPRSHHSPARARRQLGSSQEPVRLTDHTNTAEKCDRCFAQ